MKVRVLGKYKKDYGDCIRISDYVGSSIINFQAGNSIFYQGIEYMIIMADSGCCIVEDTSCLYKKNGIYYGEAPMMFMQRPSSLLLDRPLANDIDFNSFLEYNV